MGLQEVVRQEAEGFVKRHLDIMVRRYGSESTAVDRVVQILDDVVTRHATASSQEMRSQIIRALTALVAN